MHPKPPKLLRCALLVSLCTAFVSPVAAQTVGDCLTPAFSRSFSPITARSAEGELVCLQWIYRVNGGQPIPVEVEGLSALVQAGDLTLRIDPVDKVRNVHVSGTISGDISGTVDLAVSEQLGSLEGGTFIEDQTVILDQSVSSQGLSCNSTAQIHGVLDPPAEWFLDRESLDELPIGFVYDARDVSAIFDGFIEVVCPPFVDERVTFPTTVEVSVETWEITGKEALLAVGDETYENVVVVKRQTILPDQAGNPQPAEILYWVAEGVGMVRGIGQFKLLNEPLPIELVTTNVPEPSQAAQMLAGATVIALLRRRRACRNQCAAQPAQRPSKLVKIR